MELERQGENTMNCAEKLTLFTNGITNVGLVFEIKFYGDLEMGGWIKFSSPLRQFTEVLSPR